MAVSWNMSAIAGLESTYGYTASTDVRDVSEVLDSLYLADTPLVNRLTWGDATHNKKIEWISDSIGSGYVITSAAIASDGSAMVINTSGCGSVANAARQLHTGTILRTEDTGAVTSKNTGWLLVNDWSTGGSIGIEFLSGLGISDAISAGTTLYIVGNSVVEGSLPRRDTTRPRNLHSNYTQIFRQDVRMSGTRIATQMHAVSDELQLQIKLRTMEYKRELERAVILSPKYDGGAYTEGDTMGGIVYWLYQADSEVLDTSTTSLTESAVNTLLATLWDNGSNPNVLLVGAKQARQFATFERARVRVEQDSKVAGYYVQRYMSDLGQELEILVSRWVPANYCLILDTSKIKLRPMVGRKWIMQKLGLKGDFVEYQMLSELSLEMAGYYNGEHGAFTTLT